MKTKTEKQRELDPDGYEIYTLEEIAELCGYDNIFNPDFRAFLEAQPRDLTPPKIHS